MKKNTKIILIMVLSVLILLAWAPWMDEQAVHDKIFNEKAKIDGTIDRQTGELVCDYKVGKLPLFGRFVGNCEAIWFVGFWEDASKLFPSKIDCTSLKQDFDKYIERSSLPIPDNPESLCHGLTVGMDFSKLTSKWAVGKLLDITKDSNEQYWLTFEGVVKSEVMFIPLNDLEAIRYKESKYYKIDMNNLCRYFFRMIDSRYPSPISSTFVKPEEVNCK